MTVNNKRIQTSTYRLTLGLLTLSAILTACPGKEPPPNTTEQPSVGASLTPLVEPTPDPNFNPPDQPEPEIEVPVNPGNVKAKYLSDESFELTWEPVEGALAYFILHAKGADGEDVEILGDEIEEPKFVVSKASLTAPMVILVGSLNESGRSANVTELNVELASLKPAEGVPADQAQPSAIPQAPIPDPLPSPTPTPTATAATSASATPTPTPTATATTSASATPTPTPTATTSASATPTPTPTATTSASATPTPTPTATTSASATPTPTPTPTPIATATATPTPTPSATASPQSLGNGYLGYVGTTSVMDNIGGIDIKNNVIATGYLVDGFTSNERKIRQINLSNGSNTEYAVYSTFTGVDGLISGVSISSTGTIWSSLKQTNSDGYNLYANQSSGALTTRYKIPGTGLVIEDIAVDGNLVYIASPNNNSVMRFNSTDTSSNALTVLFTGATAINPAGVALDSSGNLYTADVVTGKLIKFSKSDGSRLLEFDGKGVNGTGQTFTAIGDLAVDPRNGDIYVIAVSGSSPRIYRYTSVGNFVHSFTSSEISDPDKIAIGSNGHVYVTDANKKAILAFDAGQ